MQDIELHESFKSIEEKFQADLQRLIDRKWKSIADQLAERLKQKKFTAKACRERYEAIQDGTALLPIELDEDKVGRAALREARMAAAKKRRADAAAEIEREKAEKAAAAQKKKDDAARKERERVEAAKQREAEKEKDALLKKLRADEKEAARAARRAAEAQVSAQYRWDLARRQKEKEVYEKMSGKKWHTYQHHHGEELRLQDLLAKEAAKENADDESGESEAVATAKKPESKKAGEKKTDPFDFKAMLTYAVAIGAVENTPPEAPEPVAAVTAVTQADPRSQLDTDQLVAIFKERGLRPQTAQESKDQAIARLCAADQKLTTPELHDLMKRYFIKIKGERGVKLRLLAETEVKRFKE